MWVIAEQRNGKLLKTTREVLSAGRGLADRWDGELSCVLPGYHLDGLSDEIGRYGADEVILVSDPSLATYRTLPFCGVLASLIRQHQPAVVLFSGGTTGNDLAPRLAARLKTALVTDCHRLDIAEDGTLKVTRRVYDGKLSATVQFTTDAPPLLLVPPGVMEININERKPRVSNVSIANVEDALVENISIVNADPEAIDLSEAEVIVAGGRGLGSREGFTLLKELAKALRASIGGTRVAVDNEWIPFERQVGQTGKTVNPRFYLTMGTSGAIQYAMGFKDAEFIMAVDTNPKAQIFDVADIGVVADVQQVLPGLLNLLQGYSPLD